MLANLKLKNSFKYHVIPVIILLLTAFYFSCATRYFPLGIGNYGHDAGIFSSVGHAINSGRILYTEIWENKGPLIYFINALGVKINYFYGIYFIELLAMCITVIFMYKIALIISLKNRYVSVMSSIFSIAPLCVTLEGGNLSESYALPFLCIACFVAVDFFYSNLLIKRLNIVLFGICCGAVLTLRTNICAFPFAIIIVILTVLISKNEWSKLISATLFSFTGLTISILPFVAYFSINNVWSDYFQAAFGVFEYFEKGRKHKILQCVMSMFGNLSKCGTLYIIILFFVVFLILKNKINNALKYCLWMVFLGLILNTIGNSLVAVVHNHYFMTFIPIILIPIAWFLSELFKKIAKNKISAEVAVIAITLFLISPAIPDLFNIVIWNIGDKIPHNDVERFILDNSVESETVQCIGINNTTNYKVKRLSASKHIHFAAGIFTDKAKNIIANETAQDISKNNAKIIIFGDIDRFENFLGYLDNKSDFEQFIEKNYAKIKINKNIVFFKKNRNLLKL